MTTTIRCIILGAALLIFAGCSKPEPELTDERLAEIERLLDLPEMPDSVPRMLREMDTDALSEPDRALHALLTAYSEFRQTGRMNFEHHLRYADLYFSKKKAGKYLMMLRFLQAQHLYDSGRIDSAFAPAFNSLTISGKIDNPYFMGRAEDLIASLFSKRSAYEQSITYSMGASKHFSECGREINSRACALDATMDMIKLKRFNDAARIVDSIGALTPSTDILNRKYLLYVGMDVQFERQDYRTLEAMADSLISFGDDFYFPTAYGYKSAITLSQDKDSVLARQYLDSALTYAATKEDVDFLDVVQEFYYRTKGENNQAMFYSFRNSRAMDSVINQRGREYGVQLSNLHQKSSELDGYVNEVNGLRFWIITISSLAIVVAVLFPVYHILSRRRIRKYMADISEMTDMQLKFSNIATDAFRNHIEAINRLCTNFFESSDNDNKNSERIIYLNVRKMIKEMASKKSETKIENYVTELYPKQMAFVSECNDLTDTDRIIIIYSLIGMSQKSMCVIFNMKSPTLYQRKRKLVQFFKQQNNPDLNILISALSTAKTKNTML